MITVALRIGTKETILGEKRESISLWLFAADTSLHTEQPHDAEFRLCRLLSCTREQHCWEQSPLLRCRDRTLMLNWCQRQIIAFVDTDCCLYFLPSTTKGTQVQSEFHLLITYFPCSLLTQDVARACHRNFRFYCSFLWGKNTHTPDGFHMLYRGALEARWRRAFYFFRVCDSSPWLSYQGEEGVQWVCCPKVALAVVYTSGWVFPTKQIHHIFRQSL